MRKLGLSGYNSPKRTPSHPKKSHVVLAKEGSQTKLIRFGEQGAETAGAPKAGESDRMTAKRKSFKARHARNIAKGKMSAAYWADRVKWAFLPFDLVVLNGNMPTWLSPENFLTKFNLLENITQKVANLSTLF